MDEFILMLIISKITEGIRCRFLFLQIAFNAKPNLVHDETDEKKLRFCEVIKRNYKDD